MTITSGFFNSVNEDRKYSAEQINGLFQGLISDGVFQNYGQAFAITITSRGTGVSIGSGKAWFGGRWIENSGAEVLNISNASSGKKRKDAIVLEINNSTRSGSLKVVSGTQYNINSTPTEPVLTNTVSIKQVPIYYITKTESEALTSNDVEHVIGTAKCPYIYSPVVTPENVGNYLSLWQQEFEIWLASLRTTFGEISNPSDAATIWAAITELQDRVTPIAKGGTGATSKSTAKTNLGIRYGTDSPSSVANQLDEGDVYIYISD